MSIIEILKVIILGIIEGITEWLPISSTGHLILADEFIQLDVTPEFMEMFRVVIQLGAIMAVVFLYFSRLWPFRNQKDAPNALQRYVDMDKMVLWFKILVACLPAVAIGLPFDDLLEEKLYNYVVVALMLILYGVVFLIIENYNARRKPVVTDLGDLTFKIAFFIGVFQVLSLIPGTSRSGSTIIGGILLGASRTVAAEFTFFLAIPVMFGASLLKLVKFGFHFTGAEAGILLLGMLTAFLVSVLAIKFLMGYIKKHDFKAFGWYRIVLGVLVFGYFIGKNLLA
ncbi:MAG: undecaprenyl-diphosphate phosphatase [Lachnospiraceae bacterium]|jgi:undecaprenyl-diphosphatase|nr:undecaprenyl-diphosphate phosphatase [Lachnospiraceae bacterium]MCI9101059.1 undecaprenyl-diphosphate phosphatase [Lachnospiraceae bacterium]MCI9358847.1 undecaprenyl-diphosphate phosphatase [Lachnospiraceae bacterium]